MRYFIFNLFVFISFSGICQEKTQFSGEYNETAIAQVIADIEHQTDYKFFYYQNWLDSLQVTGKYDQVEVKSICEDLFKNTPVNFYIQNQQVILIWNTQIIEELPILSLHSNQKGIPPIEKGLVFDREYKSEVPENINKENKVYEIGNKSRMRPGSEVTIAGYVKETENDAPVIGALVYLQNGTKATTTDANGFYSIKLKVGQAKLFFQYSGLKTTFRNIVLFTDGRLDVNMEIDVIALKEVIIESEKDVNIQSITSGVSKISPEAAKTVPLVLGENDILRVSTLTAGVQTVGEGAAGFNVRGGKTDQNLILLNHSTVYNPSHFFGFFSAFNSDAISDLELYKSGTPSRYGGRLSSIFDITEKTPNKQKFSGQGGISPVTSRLKLDIPILKERTSLMIAGRTTYSDLVLDRIDNQEFSQNDLSFYDILAQLHHDFNEENSLIASFYTSKDQFKLASDSLFSLSDFSYSNRNMSLQWDRMINSSLDGSLILTASNYNWNVKFDDFAPNAFTQDFDINEYSIGLDLKYYLNDQHELNFGASSKLYQINPGTLNPFGIESEVISVNIQEEKGLESALYFEDKYELNENLSLSGGIRLVAFNAIGPNQVINYQSGLPRSSLTVSDTTTFGNNSISKTYFSIEPRLSARYTLDEFSSLKASYNRNAQFIHSLSNSASLAPTDTWRLSSTHIAPQFADQFSLGYYRNLRNGKIEASLEGYYKKYKNLLDFKVGSSLSLNENIETDVLQGDGKSYGIEFSVRKSGRLNGWFNYTYSRTLIKLDSEFPEERVNGGNFFPTNYDKPHTFNLIGNYKLTRRYSVSTNLTYSSGRPITFPVGVYNLRGAQNVLYSDRNSFRIPDYFRLDIGLNIEGTHKRKKLAHSFWTLSVYNVTGRDNPYSIFFEVDDGEINAFQLLVFSTPIPTVTYNFKF